MRFVLGVKRWLISRRAGKRCGLLRIEVGVGGSWAWARLLDDVCAKVEIQLRAAAEFSSISYCI